MPHSICYTWNDAIFFYELRSYIIEINSMQSGYKMIKTVE
mgnify:CR=1 FL=1